jgi:hypothetical protein
MILIMNVFKNGEHVVIDPVTGEKILKKCGKHKMPNCLKWRSAMMIGEEICCNEMFKTISARSWKIPIDLTLTKDSEYYLYLEYVDIDDPEEFKNLANLDVDHNIYLFSI